MLILSGERVTACCPSLLEDQHDIGPKQEQVDGSQEHVGASDGECQHADDESQDEKNGTAVGLIRNCL
jgi:hypothetical protein